MTSYEYKSTMAKSATIYKVCLNLSDVDNNVYEELESRVAQHPSESSTRLAARMIAYIALYGLDTQNPISFGRGLSEVQEPALWRRDLSGEILQWVELGAPTAERMHQATKQADDVRLVCYKPPSSLSKEFAKKKIHRQSEVKVYFLDSNLCKSLGESLERTSHWSVICHDESLQLTVDETDYVLEWRATQLPGVID